MLPESKLLLMKISELKAPDAVGDADPVAHLCEFGEKGGGVWGAVIKRRFRAPSSLSLYTLSAHIHHPHYALGVHARHDVAAGGGARRIRTARWRGTRRRGQGRGEAAHDGAAGGSENHAAREERGSVACPRACVLESSAAKKGDGFVWSNSGEALPNHFGRAKK